MAGMGDEANDAPGIDVVPVRYDPLSWEGKVPKEHLEEWCVANQFKTVSYVPKTNEGGTFVASCQIHHQSVQITPDWESPTVDEAEQNAALLACVYLVGGSVAPACISSIPFSSVGVDGMSDEALAEWACGESQKEIDDLTQQKEELEKAFLAKTAEIEKSILERTQLQQLLRSADEGAQETLKDIKNQAKRKAVRTNMINSKKFRTSADNPCSEKNPIMELKELCDKNKWKQPEYEMINLQGDFGLTWMYVCRVKMSRLSEEALQSDPQPSFKLAKASAACAWLHYLGLRGAST